MGAFDSVRYVINGTNEYAERVCKLRPKNKLLVKADMLACLLVHHVHAFEYFSLGFDAIPREKRKTYMTTYKVRLINRYLDDAGSENMLTNKYYAGTALAEFYKRPCIQNIGLSFETFSAFLRGRDRFILKPVDGFGGEGHVVYRKSDGKTPEEMYAEIIAAPRSVLEGWIEQHETMNLLYPDAVHTIRLHTIHDGSGRDIKVFGANLSIAFGGELANTHYKTTICCQVDDDTGVIVTDGLQRDLDVIYTEIPSTHTKLRGFQLPDWEEALQLVKNAAAAIPETAFIGWDVAFTPDGPGICEGNTHPGVVNYQHYAWYEDGYAVGWWPLVKPYVDKKRHHR